MALIKQGCKKENSHVLQKEATKSSSQKNASGTSIRSSATAVTIPTLRNVRFRQSLPASQSLAANAASYCAPGCLSTRACMHNLRLLACCLLRSQLQVLNSRSRWPNRIQRHSHSHSPRKNRYVVARTNHPPLHTNHPPLHTHTLHQAGPLGVVADGC